jgi:RND family efflux transporter MFP subunit
VKALKLSKRMTLVTGLAVLTVLMGATVANLTPPSAQEDVSTTATTAQPSLAVQVTVPTRRELPMAIAANGDIAAWQDVSIGTELGGLRLERVYVDVGDLVAQGQLLATLAADNIRAEVAQSRATLDEARAVLAGAAADVQRARSLKGSGSISEQQIHRYETTKAAATARRDLAAAQLESGRLRLEQTKIIAPDGGVIAARLVSAGAVMDDGQELFRLIRQGRLEWHAEVASVDLDLLHAGQTARISLPGGQALEGRIRAIAPLVDAATRNGLVYVDLQESVSARAGMYARGELGIGVREALTLPRSAVQVRDGFGYVHRVDDKGLVAESKVVLGQQALGYIEIVSGLEPDARVVASGGAFLGNGDWVHVIGLAKADAASAAMEQAGMAAPAAMRQP